MPKIEVDFGYATDLIVGGVIAADAKAHEAMIPYTHAPFDFTMQPDDPAAVRALEYVAGSGADTTTDARPSRCSTACVIWAATRGSSTTNVLVARVATSLNIQSLDTWRRKARVAK